MSTQYWNYYCVFVWFISSSWWYCVCVKLSKPKQALKPPFLNDPVWLVGYLEEKGTRRKLYCNYLFVKTNSNILCVYS